MPHTATAMTIAARAFCQAAFRLNASHNAAVAATTAITIDVMNSVGSYEMAALTCSAAMPV